MPRDIAEQVNATGREKRIEDSGEVLLPYLENIVQTVDLTDVFVMSHGWHTKKDENNAIKFAQNLARSIVANDPHPESHRILFIAVHWPSHPFTAFQQSTGTSSDQMHDRDSVAEIARLYEENPFSWWRALQKTLSSTDPKAASAVDEVVEEIQDPEIDHTLAAISGDTSDINALPDSIVKKLSNVAQYLSPGAEQNGQKTCPLDDDNTPDTDVLVKDNSIPFLKGTDGPIAKTLSVDVAHRAITIQKILKYFSRIKSMFGFLPSVPVHGGIAVVARAMERIFFGQFQRRAAVVGARGVHRLLSRLMMAAQKRQEKKVTTKFHVIGRKYLGSQKVSCTQCLHLASF